MRTRSDPILEVQNHQVLCFLHFLDRISTEVNGDSRRMKMTESGRHFETPHFVVEFKLRHMF